MKEILFRIKDVVHWKNEKISISSKDTRKKMILEELSEIAFNDGNHTLNIEGWLHKMKGELAYNSIDTVANINAIPMELAKKIAKL